MPLPRIALSEGDSVGRELIAQVRKVLRALELRCGVTFEVVDVLTCGPAIEAAGDPLPGFELEKLSSCRALLFGNIGAERYRSLPNHLWPEQALLQARKSFGVCTNLRPVRIHPGLHGFSPLKEEIIGAGMDILIVRDLMGGMITGHKTKSTVDGQREASDLEYYREQMIEVSTRLSFSIARTRRKKVTSLDKANVLYSSLLWREKVQEIAEDYPDIALDNAFIDAAAMAVIARPADFDVILTSNVFGDILSDEITELSGTPWLFGSAEIARDGRGIYTPNQLHHPRGDALEGRGEVSPYGVLSALAMLLEHSLGRRDLAGIVGGAIETAIGRGLFTAEQGGEGEKLSTDALGDAIAELILQEKQ